MNFRKTLSLIIANILIKLLRIIGRGGTSLPGKLALNIYPNILKEISKDITTIIITGTNGKTTTSRIISEMLKKSNKTYFENKSGANLISGITTTFIENYKLNKEYAVIECDEAAFKNVSKNIAIGYIVVTNLFRDQLDRYGEITHTLNNILQSIKNCSNAIVCLNADCSLTSSISDTIQNKVIFYGIDIPIYNSVKILSDAPYCIKCKTKYEYTYRTYGHLGGFYCPSCGYARKNTNISVAKILNLNKYSSKVIIKVGESSYTTKINLPGGYNIYNGLSAFAIGYAIKLDNTILVNSLASFKGGFGRMEQLKLNNVDTNIILVKNPAGLNNVINYITNLKEPIILTILLNDKYADGIDVSWIWDVNFEILNENIKNIKKIFVSGIRYDDMALRLKYADIPLEKIIKINNYNQLINEITAEKYSEYTSIVLPTYTAMFDLRLKLTKKFKLKNFWK